VTLNIKRNVTIQVVVTDTFKKQYIVLMNQFIDSIQEQIDQYQQILNKVEQKPEFISYVQDKQNAQLLQKEQCMQQIEKVKECVIGDSFIVSTTEGFFPVQKGDQLLKTLVPVVVQAEDNIIASIIPF
jgi:hypothetical protein